MTVYCDYCGHKAELVDDTVIYGHSYGHKAYLCRYCGAYVGCHGRSDKPMGRLADAGLRRKRWRHTQPLIRFGNAAHSAAVAKMPMHGWPGKWHCPSSRPISECLTNGSASK